MLTTLTELKNLLAKLGISERKVLALPIPECSDLAFAIEVIDDDLILWTKLHSVLAETGRYPLLYACWGGNGLPWEECLKTEDMFMRFPFTTSQNSEVSPAGLIARVNELDYGKICERHNQNYSESLLDQALSSLAYTQQRFLTSPTAEDVTALINSGEIKSYFAFEQWLLNWEITHCDADNVLAPDYTGYIDWFQPIGQTQLLLLLPITESWQALAFIHWYGAETIGSDAAMAMLKYWQQHYGAKLVAHYGTMLQLEIESLPANIEEAFLLACQQESLAPCTTALPGVSLRDHARTLLTSQRWFLHERP